MQWRWLFPLLLSFPNSPFLPLPDDYSLYTSVPYGQHILHYLSTYHLPPTQSPSFTWPLLFPACRHSSLPKIFFFLSNHFLLLSIPSSVALTSMSISTFQQVYVFQNQTSSISVPSHHNIHPKYDTFHPTRNTSTAQSSKRNYSPPTFSSPILKIISSGTVTSITLKYKHMVILQKPSSRHYDPK